MLGSDLSLYDQLLLSMSFSECQLNFSNFSHMKLQGFSFKKSNITEAFFNEKELAKADFSRCDLMGTSFNKNDLKGANFIGAKNYLINPLNNKLEQAQFDLPEALSLLSFSA